MPVDFFAIREKVLRDGAIRVYPEWLVRPNKDLMIRGGAFYAVWDEREGLWSTNLYDVFRIVDDAVMAYVRSKEDTGKDYIPLLVSNFDSRLAESFQRYTKQSRDSYFELDGKLTFANTVVTREDHASKRLPYSLEDGSIEAWDQIIGTLYSESERRKIEWAIGAVVSGESVDIQKFLVLYGKAGTGKSTILKVIEKLFNGYVGMFDAKTLTSNNAFATAAFRSNPLVAIQHDGDMSKILDNTKLNSIVSHETMLINEKFKSDYPLTMRPFIFMGTNQPVKITDSKSGLLRRLIDVKPTETVIPFEEYLRLMKQIDFELGAIANHCLSIFAKMGPDAYSAYRPTDMMYQTDEFYNYVESVYDIFKAEEGITLRRAWMLYREFCEDAKLTNPLQMYKVREELKSYFERFQRDTTVDGKHVRNYYSGFKGLDGERIVIVEPEIVGNGFLELMEQDSLLDKIFSDRPAQYATDQGTPKQSWDSVETTLSDIDTSQVHYIRPPDNHIVIDIDRTDEDGNKSLEVCLEAADAFPSTYAEVSKSGSGIHLHYDYTGDIEKLMNIYDVGIEVKTFRGKSALRRRLSRCNSLDISVISGGLPIKERKRESVLDSKSVKSERSLRHLIVRNLRKEIHPATRPSVDFIKKILDDAYESGLSYNVEDMRHDILALAIGSTNHSNDCVKIVQSMHFVGKDDMPEHDGSPPLVFFDVEVYPNLFVVCWKAEGSEKVVKMINPTASDIEKLLDQRLVGFNNRRYDNHILYARYLGESVQELYNRSQHIIVDRDQGSMIPNAYGLSYADVYDFSAKKQGLKKFEIELGIHHMELDLPWDEPVDESKWPLVADYCANDVAATEAVFNARKEDYNARLILSELSGLSVNATTRQHTEKIIFGQAKNPKASFEYTDLSEMFPGYEFKLGVSSYRGENPSEGGYVYAEPGAYDNVAVLDIASMHPTSIELLNLFGPYTERFTQLKDARIAIKRHDLDKLDDLLDGKLVPFVQDESQIEGLSYALKIVINSVYGLTNGKWDNNLFFDPRNIDNIVAKRGALFMIDLKNAVQERGYTVAHIKTDSIKIPNASVDILEFVIDFGKKYGYDFEYEVKYDKFCLVNDAVYIARHGDDWTAVGAQFQHPYVYKSLFTNEPLVFADYCETKNVTKGAMYLGDCETVDGEEVCDLRHVGRTGRFTPVMDGFDLWRVDGGKRSHVVGTKGHKWVLADIALMRMEEDKLDLDESYFDALTDDAVSAISQFEPFETFVSRKEA